MLRAVCRLMYDPPSPRTRAARALRPPSWHSARSAPITADAPDTDTSANVPRTYLTRLAQPFDDPYEYVPLLHCRLAFGLNRLSSN